MVIQLFEHMGVMGTNTKATVKFNQLPKVEQMWAKAKTWFCVAVLNVTEMERYSSIDGDLLANAAVIAQNAKQEARDEVASGMQELFGQLAQAVVAKSETIDAHVASISSLTKALVEMTATYKTLTATNSTLITALEKCGGKTGTNPPPRFSQAGATTGHAANTDGVACPTHLHTNPKTRKKHKITTFVTR